MKVILLEDVRSHGKKGDVIEVADGYARNVLIRKKQAIEATSVNLNDLKMKQKRDARIAAENLEDAKELAKKMQDWMVETKIKTGEGGKTFGSISSKEIAAAISKQYGEKVDKKKIVVEEAIKSLGVHEVKVKLHPEVLAILRVHVSEQD